MSISDFVAGAVLLLLLILGAVLLPEIKLSSAQKAVLNKVLQQQGK